MLKLIKHPRKPQTYGERLRHYRTQANITMGQAARYLGIGVAHLSAVERGRKDPLTPGQTEKIAYLLGIKPSQLTTDKTNVDL